MNRSWHMLVLLIAGTCVANSTSLAFGQGNVFNPYGNSGYADYREFAKPTYNNDPSLPGQARLQSGEVSGRNRSNQFDSYVNSLDNNSDQFNSNRGVPSGLPYYQAQRFASRDRQGFQANDSVVERQYQDQVRKRNDAYFKALTEPDPRKRAIKLQQIERQDVVARTPARGQRSSNQPPATGTSPARRPSTAPTSPGAPVSSATTPRPGSTTNQPEAAPVTSPSSVPIPAPN